MATDFEIKQHDTLPEITGICADALGAIPNLSGASVLFIMTNKSTGTRQVQAAASVIDITTGTVSYAWVAGDTDISGSFFGEFEVHYSSPAGAFETFPNSRNLNIKIFPDLGGVAP